MIPFFIPTYRRVGRQITIHQFPRSMWGKWVWLVAPADEDHGDLPVIVAPKEVCGSIATKRQWISEYAQRRYDFHGQIDDDTKMTRRDKGHFDVRYLIRKCHEVVTQNPDVGIVMAAPRAFSMGKPDLVFNQSAGGVFRVYRTEALQNCNARFDDFRVLEDHHIMLSIIESGYRTATIFEWLMANQSGPKFSGGTQTSTDFSKVERYDAEAKRMIADHSPDLIYWRELQGERELNRKRSVPSNILIKTTVAGFYKKNPPFR